MIVKEKILKRKSSIEKAPDPKVALRRKPTLYD